MSRFRRGSLSDAGRRPRANRSYLLRTCPSIDLDRPPEERLRGLYDAFHLELRDNDLTSELDLRVTITGDTATELGATVHAVLGTQEAGALPGLR